MSDIFQAALKNDALAIKEYLKFGDVNVVDSYGSSLLHYAARGNSLEVANILLDNYINLNIINKSGETPLFEAIARGELGFCKLLSRYHAVTNLVNVKGETIYFKAILKGKKEILDLIEDTLQIDYNFTNFNGENALFFAMKAHNNKLFIKLANLYPELINGRNYSNINLLMLSVKNQNEELFNFLINKFNNLYELDKEGNNILFYIAKYGTYSMMKRILEYKPIIEGKNNDGEDIITLANNNPNLVYILLDTYKSSYDYNLYKKTYPFHVAVIKKDYDLLEYTPDINKKDALGISVLDYINFVRDDIIYKIFKLRK